MIDCCSGVRLERGLRCTLSDGVRLASDHYDPAAATAGPGPWPTLLMRQPYGRDIASTVVYAHPVWLARHGYHVVIQDVRGRGDSEGDFYAFRHEGRDGAETIAWLRGHAACNGRIGMYGFSYQGATQLLAAAEFISMGIARSSWLFKDRVYAAAAVHCWEFALEPTSIVIAAGRRGGRRWRRCWSSWDWSMWHSAIRDSSRGA